MTYLFRSRGSRMTLAGLLLAIGLGLTVVLSGFTRAADGDQKKAKGAAIPKWNHSQLAKFIDEQIEARCKDIEVSLSERSSDEEFVRRVYLDIVGTIPTAEQVEQFLNSTAPDKRARLIDQLLDDPRYGKFFGEAWANAMIPNDSINRRLASGPLQTWFEQKLNSGAKWDDIVREVVNASGPIDENGAVTFFIGNPSVDKVTDKVTQLFMGVQLACAQCHNHPFTDVKQKDYWGMAQFFTNVTVNGNPNQAAKKGITLTVTEVSTVDRKKGVRRLQVPQDAQKVPPKFLAAEEPSMDRKAAYRPVLAEWMTAKENRFFARAIANKLWHHFYGRGIVNPVDDMHDDNPATHPELLAALEEQLKANDFDLKYLIRAICNSETYQRTSRPNGNNADDRELFSRAMVRMMTPEQLYDSLNTIVSVSAPEPDIRVKAKKKVKVAARNVGNARAQFVAFFSSDNGFDPLDYQNGIPQALRMMNSRQFNTNGVILAAMRKGKTPDGTIEQIYLSTLSRRPTAAETERLTQYVNSAANPQVGYNDILWAILNSSEFSLNH